MIFLNYVASILQVLRHQNKNHANRLIYRQDSSFYELDITSILRVCLPQQRDVCSPQHCKCNIFYQTATFRRVIVLVFRELHRHYLGYWHFPIKSTMAVSVRTMHFHLSITSRHSYYLGYSPTVKFDKRQNFSEANRL